MTDTVAFRAALGRIGFNPATADGIVGQGYDSIDSLTTLTGDKDVGTLDKPMMNGWRVPPAPAAAVAAVAPVPVNLMMPYLSVQKVKTMRYYSRLRDTWLPHQSLFANYRSQPRFVFG
jgi:hypothetical protein